MVYDFRFYDTIRLGCQTSARIVVGGFLKEYSIPFNVLDIGCGEGWWAREFLNRGSFGATGVDNDGFDSPNRAELDNWVKSDIPGQLSIDRGIYDLIVCLEVAEHLPKTQAETLVELLCHSDQIMFSAAIPMQGGWGHVNEQWPEYWIRKFNMRGYQGKHFGKYFWGDSLVEPWYQQNLFVFENRSDFTRQSFPPFVHPAFWSTRTGAPLP